MKEGYQTRKLIFNKKLGKDIYKMRVEGDFKAQPGQFYMLRAWSGLDPFLSRPISVNDLADGYIDFLYQDIGRGTGLMSSLKEGDRISLLGPLGQGFKDIEGDRIALVAGGIGLAPLIYLAKSLDKRIDFYCGFREEVYGLDQLEDHVERIYIATEDGSQGHKGLVTELIDYENYDQIVTCGPRPMMEAIYREKKETIVSMEERMACGIGACMGCNIRTREGNKRVCKDGPVFKGEEVFLDA